jgi:hypothetical protein
VWGFAWLQWVTALPGVPGVSTGSDRAGVSFPQAGMVRAGQLGAGRAHSRLPTGGERLLPGPGGADLQHPLACVPDQAGGQVQRAVAERVRLGWCRWMGSAYLIVAKRSQTRLLSCCTLTWAADGIRAPRRFSSRWDPEATRARLDQRARVLAESYRPGAPTSEAPHEGAPSARDLR